VKVKTVGALEREGDTVYIGGEATVGKEVKR